jgi:uncharacterized membrane protein (DUF485 family)
LGMIISTSAVIVVNIIIMVTWIRFVLSIAHYVNCVMCIPVFSNFVIDRLMGIGFLVSGQVEVCSYWFGGDLTHQSGFR